jgi:hypothetical protein
MSEIRPVDGFFPSHGGFSYLPAVAESGGSAAAVQDRVEISDLARVLSDALESVARDERIAELKASIARGDYLTHEKLDAALERALKDL